MMRPAPTPASARGATPAQSHNIGMIKIYGDDEFIDITRRYEKKKKIDRDDEFIDIKRAARYIDEFIMSIDLYHVDIYLHHVDIPSYRCDKDLWR